MAYGQDWDAQMLLDRYIHDYMVKKKMHKAADIFAREASVCRNPVLIDTPEGFLTEWWAIFWDTYYSRLPKQPEAKAESSAKVTKMRKNELQNISPVVPSPEMNRQRTKQFPICTDFDKMPGQSVACFLAAKMFEAERLRIPPIDLSSNLRLLDVDKVALKKPSLSNASHLQPQTSKKSQQMVARDARQGIGLGRSIPSDSTLHGIPRAVYPRTELHDAGKNKGVNPTLLRGWPLTGVGPVSSGMGHQVLNPLLLSPNQQQQFQTLAAYPQHYLSSQGIAQTPGKLISSLQGSTGNSSKLMLSRSNLSRQDGLMMVPMRQTDERQMMFTMKQTAEQQQKYQLYQQQLHENTRKRKSLSNLLAGDGASGDSDAKADKPLDEYVKSYLSYDYDTADVMSNSFGT